MRGEQAAHTDKTDKRMNQRTAHESMMLYNKMVWWGDDNSDE